MSEIKQKCEHCMHFEHDPSHHLPEWFCALGNVDGPIGCQDHLPDLERERDEEAVAQMAVLMRTKLAIKRREGRGGWWDAGRCRVEFLAELLVEHLSKGDLVDVANFAMMLQHRDGGGAAMSGAIESALAQARAEERERCAKRIRTYYFPVDGPGDYEAGVRDTCENLERCIRALDERTE